VVSKKWSNKIEIGALRSLGAVILEDHLKGCVATAIQNKDNESGLISEVVEIFNKFSK